LATEFLTIGYVNLVLCPKICFYGPLSLSKLAAGSAKLFVVVFIPLPPPPPLLERKDVVAQVLSGEGEDISGQQQPRIGGEAIDYQPL
jgi:hypothetical protein